MPFPKYDDIHLPLLKLIHNNSISSMKEAAKVLVNEFDLTEEELNERVKSGVNKFYSQVNFSRKRLTDAGLICRNTKPYCTTNKATKILNSNMKKLANKDINLLIKNEKRNKNHIKGSFKKTKNQIYDNLLTQLKKSCSPYFFEHLTGLLLTRVYNIDQTNLEITPPINDSGIDGIIHLKDNSKVYFQSKLWEKPIGRPDLQKFVGALEGVNSSKGYYFTTSSYSSAAKTYIENVKHDITLIDGHKLIELIRICKLKNAGMYKAIAN